MHAAIVEAGSDITRIDPLRHLQGLMGGIGFLGAGARDAACGRSHLLIAGATAGLAPLVLQGLGVVEHRVYDPSPDSEQVPR